MPWAQSHGFVLPHSQMLSTIGRPLARSARAIFAYESRVSWPSALHQSYFR
jgi:hypothetical protein